MLKKFFLLILSGTILTLQAFGSFAQDATVATHIPKSEIMAALQGITTLPDQQARVVDIGGGINVAVGILQRGATSTEEGEAITALAHHQITEVYYVISGVSWPYCFSHHHGRREHGYI
ncbi:MAG TPA: hypothetical protein DCM64_10450 [Gammaproteobacteria bacterium]|jgi:hypothetical protein|nr:hypothetical protein [Gammaproteobacteria bacterium]MDP6732736.1 hypothetical protein [Gammaproteobacteria bacterium]HAJ76863.1 hypothetical protein [Gammaproteobacteria bacterium]|tara:strand:+ start:2033 stop:2389 length:357 start_codon:yes stop_codon:yes gene_type:complete